MLPEQHGTAMPSADQTDRVFQQLMKKVKALLESSSSLFLLLNDNTGPEGSGGEGGGRGERDGEHM